jgi:hypothetical protein
MFQGFCNGVPSSIARRTHLGQQTCVTQKGPPSRGGEFVGAFTGEYALEDQVAHLELPVTHEPLVIAPERLTVLCVASLYAWTRGEPMVISGGGGMAIASYIKKKGVSPMA